jgi:formimidoylglutamate deiminase
MLEEMRWLELGQRLRTRTRGVVVDPATGRPGPALLESAARHGARSLGLPGGVIAPGRLADLFAVDLEHPLVAGWTEEMLLDSLIFGGGHEVIREVAVGGRWVGE